MVKYATPDLIDLSDSAIGYGANCDPGSAPTGSCNPTGYAASPNCDGGQSATGNCAPTGGSANNRCNTGSGVTG